MRLRGCATILEARASAILNVNRMGRNFSFRNMDEDSTFQQRGIHGIEHPLNSARTMTEVGFHQFRILIFRSFFQRQHHQFSRSHQGMFRCENAVHKNQFIRIIGTSQSKRFKFSGGNSMRNRIAEKEFLVEQRTDPGVFPFLMLAVGMPMWLNAVKPDSRMVSRPGERCSPFNCSYLSVI